MKSPKETDLVTACMAYLAMLPGCCVWRQNQGARPDKTGRWIHFTQGANADGIADIVGLMAPEGRLLAVECKRPGSRTDKARKARQDAFGERVTRHGGVYLRVETLQQLVDGLAAAEKGETT